jgi:thiol-disulfide isomerase/thioredoxin
MINPLKKSLLLAALCCSIGASAQTVAAPTITTYSNSTIILGITQNGKWAIFEARGEEATGGKILEIESGTLTDVLSANSDTNGSVADISNDGNTVVGVYQDKPAYWNRTTQTWTTLGTKTGSAVAVTADGRYAVGHVSTGSSIYLFTYAMWDLTTGQQVALNNVPVFDLTGIDPASDNEKSEQNQFNNISADGRYILGVCSVSYPSDVAFYVYDRQTETYDYIGFTVGQLGARFTPKVENLHHIETANMSASGKYITGSAYMVTETDEFEIAYRYNCETKDFEVYNETGDSGIVGFGIDDNGVVYGATPTTSPLRDAYVRHGKYWYSITQILKQRYGIDFEAKTGLENTGTPTSVSSDGLIFGTFTDPQTGEGYIMKLNESLYDACESVDLLGNYTISPVSGAKFATLTSLTISFDRAVTVVGSVKGAKLLSSDGSTVRSSMGITANNSKVTIQFRPTDLTEGETYTVQIPAGTIAMDTDNAVTNREINVKYIGRVKNPVGAINIYPANGSTISKLDYSSSHVTITYDTYITTVDGVVASVYRNDETEAYATLSLSASNNQLTLYPSSTLYLFKDSSYRIVLPAGAVTDLGGSCANEEVTINYNGNYEREISSTDTVLFSEDFSNGFGAQLMYYEGDYNVPTSEMQGYGFTQSTYPWQIASDENVEVKDYCIMSHSSYSPAGTSDDWMVIPQLYIPDEKCYLSFDAQGFSKYAKDELHVYIIPCETVYNELTNAAITKFKEDRILAFNEVLDPGASEANLAGDWTTYEVDLSKYAEQDVYIAFVNENYDQSIVFVDNIQVIHNMRFTTLFDNETSVIAKDDITLYGRIAVQSAVASYSKAHLDLYDSANNLIDSVDYTDQTINSESALSFRFNKPLSLTVGKTNDFKVKVTLDDEGYFVSGTITDLAFAPTKRVVLEEYAGSECGNCPLGTLVIERLQKEIPDNFIALSIRTYNSDALGNGLSSYSVYLGLDNMGAPSACINRKHLAYPMIQSGTTYVYKAPEGKDALWADIVADELSEYAIADVNVSATLDEDANTLTIPFSVTYALDVASVNASVLFEVIEHNLITYQRNYLYNLEDQPNLGEWQKGGLYGTAEYVYPVYANDVVRSVIGKTFNGTQGYLPDTVTAGVENTNTVTVTASERVTDWNNAEVVAIVIDNNTDQVINAAKCKVVTAGIGSVAIDAPLSVAIDDNGNIVASDSQALIQVYDLTGRAIASSTGVAPTNGYKGIAIVKATSASGSVAQKVVIR